MDFRQDQILLEKSPSLIQYFENQINLIKSEEIKQLLISFLENIPKYKMEKPTSGSGKYHPFWQNDYAGNGIHTKNVIKILQVFERAFPNLRWDEIYCAAILHDIEKWENSEIEFTTNKHPKLAAEEFETFCKEKKIPKKFYKFVCHLIMWHDGRFNFTYADKEKIKANYTKGLKKKMKYTEAFILHSADMISSSIDLWESYI